MFERPSAPAIKTNNNKPSEMEIEHRRQWGDGGGTPVISQLLKREIQNATYTSDRGMAS